MIRPCLLAYVEDWDVRTKLEETARLKNIECYLAGRGEQLSQLAKTFNPFLVIIDLCAPDSEWLFRHIAFVKFTRPHLRIIAMIYPGQLDVKNRAESYGCDMVILKSELIKKAADLIEQALRKG